MAVEVSRESAEIRRNKGIKDAGSTVDFRILFEIFEILEKFDFFETFKFFDIF